MKPTIYRYRTNFSDGEGVWEYTDRHYCKENVKEFCDREYDWSQHYRGCDVEEVTFPSIEWAQKRVAEIEAGLKYRQSLLEYYRAYLSGVSAQIFDD